MTFLELVQRLRQEAGVSGGSPGTLVGASAEVQRYANWINAAWMDIQTLHDDWYFLRSTFSFNTVAQQQTYTASQCGISALGNFKNDSLRLYSPSLGYSNEMILPYLPYDTLRDMYMFGNMRTTYARPVAFSIDPQKNLVLGTTPDQVYTVNGEYYKQPSLLSGDGDTPALPTQYHLAIVYRALMLFGGYESAKDIFMLGQAEYAKILRRIERDQIPDPVFGAPLA